MVWGSIPERGTCSLRFNANFLHKPKSRDVGLVTIAQWTDTIVDFVDAFRLCLHVSVGRVSARVSVRVRLCSRAGLRNRILRRECLRCCCCCYCCRCCLLSVARRLLVVGSFLFSLRRFRKRCKGFCEFGVVFSLDLFVCWQQVMRLVEFPAASKQRSENWDWHWDRHWDRDLGLGSDRESAALFVLASWRVLCVCCNQITNDHKKSSSSSSALRLQCVVVIVVVFILMPQAARLHFKERDPPILSLTKQSSLVWFWFLVYLSIPFDSFRFFALFYFRYSTLCFLLVSDLQIVASSC